MLCLVWGPETSQLCMLVTCTIFSKYCHLKLIKINLCCKTTHHRDQSKPRVSTSRPGMPAAGQVGTEMEGCLSTTGKLRTSGSEHGWLRL